MTKRFRLTGQKIQLSENDVERAVIDLLRYRGYYVVRLQVGTFQTKNNNWLRVGEPGLPDYCAIHAVHPGFFIEVKRPGKHPSEVQVQKHAELRLFYRVAVAVIDDVKALIVWLADHEGKAIK